jgi:hypothetical protein
MEEWTEEEIGCLISMTQKRTPMTHICYALRKSRRDVTRAMIEFVFPELDDPLAVAVHYGIPFDDTSSDEDEKPNKCSAACIAAALIVGQLAMLATALAVSS